MAKPALSMVLLTSLLAWAPGAARASTNEQLEVFDQEAYRTRIEPAVAAYLDAGKDGPLLALLRETKARLTKQPRPGRKDGKLLTPLNEVTHRLRLLEGDTTLDHLWLPQLPTREAALREMVEFTLVPLLVDVWCVQWVDGAPLELGIWDSPVAKHLYQRSAWIKDAFDGTSPRTDHEPRFSRCSATGFLPPTWVARFDGEVRRAGRPPARAAARDYDALVRMLDALRARPALRLALVSCEAPVRRRRYQGAGL